MDALKHLVANIPDWLRRLEELNGQVERRKADLLQLCDLERSNNGETRVRPGIRGTSGRDGELVIPNLAGAANKSTPGAGRVDFGDRMNHGSVIEDELRHSEPIYIASATVLPPSKSTSTTPRGIMGPQAGHLCNAAITKHKDPASGRNTVSLSTLICCPEISLMTTSAVWRKTAEQRSL